MLNTAQFHAMIPEIQAHSDRSRAHDNAGPYDPFYQDHEAHGNNPAYRAAGWDTPHNCGYTHCPHYNEEVFDWGHGAIERAHEDPNPRRGMLDVSRAPIRANESVIDVDHVQRLLNSPEPVGSHKPRPPRLLQHSGGLYVLDGHHRLLAAHLRGERLPVEVSRG